MLLFFITSLCSCTILQTKRKQAAFQPVIPPKVSKQLLKTSKSREKELIVLEKEKAKTTEEVLRWPGKKISKTRGIVLGKRKKRYKLSLLYDTIDLYQLITNIFYDVLKKNFVLEGKLDTTVSVSLQGNFTERELIDFVSFLLDSAGYTLVSKGGVFYVKPKRTLPQSGLFSNYYWWFYKPQFVSVKEIASLFMPLKGPDGIIQIINNSSILIIDDRMRVLNFKALVSLIDTDVFSGYEFRIFKVRYSEPSELEKELEETLKAVGLKPKEVFSLIPIDRLNYLIVVAKSKVIADKITTLIRTLDTPSSVREKKVYIYRVQHVDVEKLAATLKKFLSGKEEIAVKKKRKKEEKTAILKGGIIIVPDPVTNSLLIEATPRDYERIKHIISELDSMPRQVLIEVLIAEVSLDKELEYGIEWWLRVHAHSYTGTAAISYGLESIKDKLVGFTYYGINPEHFWNFMYFLTTNSKINVLSSPHIIVRDNQKAKIDVGKEVPILTMETVGTTQIQGSSAIDRRVEYRDVGIILEVKPHISEEGFVTLEITEETSNPEPNTVSGIDSPIISKRRVNTTLIVKNGHTVVIGGIIDTRKENVKKAVPVLSKIPFLGNLFTYERNHKSRTELIVMLTPYVINNVREADIITSVFQNRLKSLVRGKQSRSLKGKIEK